MTVAGIKPWLATAESCAASMAYVNKSRDRSNCKAKLIASLIGALLAGAVFRASFQIFISMEGVFNAG